MRLMTRDISGGEYDLIAIEEAKEDAPQQVFFTIPIDFSGQGEITDSISLKSYFQKNAFGATVLNQGRRQNIRLYYNSEVNGLYFKLYNREVVFLINENMNLINEPIQSGFHLIPFLGAVLNRLLKSLGSHSTMKQRSGSNLLYKYSGEMFSEKFEGHRFVVLTLANTIELDKLYFENQVFFIN